MNWSAVRGSNTDFNTNSRVNQGGCGFASDNFDPGQCFNKVNNMPPGPNAIANPAIYDHGITQGGSDALDAQTLWIFAAVRPLHQPQPAAGSADAEALTRGRRSLINFAPPAMVERSGQRVRSFTAPTLAPSLR